jgi:hypothetical protein
LELWQQSQWYVKTWTLLLALIPGAIHTVPHTMEVIRPVWIILETPGDLWKPVRKPPSLVRIDVAVTLEDAKQQADGGDGDAGWRLVIMSPNNPLTHYQNRSAISPAKTTDSTIFLVFYVFDFSRCFASRFGSDGDGGG